MTETVPDAHPRAARPAGRVRTLWWGLWRRCPRCGSGHLFRRYFRMVPDCPRCGLHFEREQGYWVGALAINIIATGGLLALTVVVGLALTVPDVPVVPLLALVLPIGILGPIVFYPCSKTLWAAVDRAFLQRLDPGEQLDEIVRH
ncbi:MAG: DUF983 domain-containing protein [Acidimicrobiia bacterium]|nr:DUF983 domain-containing protein [Acidimicrobiia bacterium]